MEAMTDCHDRDMALSAWVDGELGQSEKLQVDAHLATCERCRTEVARFERLSAMVREADAEETADRDAPSGPPSGGSRRFRRPALAWRWRAWAPVWARPVWVPLKIAAVLAHDCVPVLPAGREPAGGRRDRERGRGRSDGVSGKKSTIIIVRDRIADADLPPRGCR
jgi:anti-sigma factor RsiW